MNTETTYLGLHLRNPLVASASPLAREVDNLRRLEDAGIGAVVLHSLFEEQIEAEGQTFDDFLARTTDMHAEAGSYFPEMVGYNQGPEAYLEHIARAKAALEIPVVASLNGATPGGWVRYARLMEEAGADALELNLFIVPTDPAVSSAWVEASYIEILRSVRQCLGIPLAVKLGPYFSSMGHMARQLEEAGAEGLVLFNRFYQPDFDLDALEVAPSLHLSTSEELRLRLHWAAILYGHVSADLAITGGVHSGYDVLKSMMAGAKVACTTSALLRHGIGHVRTMLQEMCTWMEERDYESVEEMRGSMSRNAVPNPDTFLRANYMKVLQSYSLRP
jgi:dihydroorotate dehydrogenase (fumarate)